MYIHIYCWPLQDILSLATLCVCASRVLFSVGVWVRPAPKTRTRELQLEPGMASPPMNTATISSFTVPLSRISLIAILRQ